MTTTPAKSKPLTDSATAVPPGYKRTEIGVIPQEWGIGRLGELGQCSSGGTPRKNDARFWGGEIPWVSSKDMKRSRLSDTTDHVTKLAIANGTRLADVGTILMVVRGMSLAHSFPVAILERPMAFNQDIKSFAPHAGFSNEFLLQWLQANQRRLLSLVAEATHGTKRMPTADLLGSHAPLPDPREQLVIAGALSDVDRLIEAMDQLIAKKRATKRAAMQQLLTGRTRLPGFSVEWETKPLGELADIKNGATPSTHVAAYWNGDIPWCTPTDITSTPGKYLGETERRITAEGMANCAASLLPAGALLLCSRATIGELKIAAAPMCTNQGFKSLICKAGMSGEFLYYLLQALRPQMIERAIGSTFLEIGKRDLASIQVTLPEHGEQTAIATVLSDMDAEIAALEARRDKTRALKQGMMPELLTGRIRLV